MDADFLDGMRRSVSSIRLESYRPLHGSDADMVRTYFWDMALAKEMITPLHAVELCLRNSINEALSERFGTQLWFYTPGLLEPGQLQQLASALESLARRKAAASPGRIVAELMFGFWVSLLSKNYEERIWQPSSFAIFKQVFPYATGLSIKHVRGEYGHLRLFRNRVFHYESIWDRDHLIDDYERMLVAIAWINPALRDVIQQSGSFERVFAGGDGYRHILDQVDTT